jgi:hypothetical protein
MTREILKPAAILALALIAAAGAPAAGVLASNAAFGAEKTVVTASLGAEAGKSAFKARVTQTGLRYQRRGVRRWQQPNWRQPRRRRPRYERWPDRRITAPLSFNCVVEKDWQEGNGAIYTILRIVNTGTVAIPAGTRFQWQVSTGQTGSFTLYHPIAPGQQSTAIDVTSIGWLNGATCAAQSIHVQRLQPRRGFRPIN